MKKKYLAVMTAIVVAMGYVSFIKANDNPPVPTLPDGNDELINLICKYEKVQMDEGKGELKCSGTGRQCCIMR